MYDFAVYMQDNKKLDFVIINEDTCSIDDALIFLNFIVGRKRTFCEMKMDASSFFL
jgi:hypothetical protein